jgi:anti-sigma regulatory factor (Ser/Thr protein kinase)
VNRLEPVRRSIEIDAGLDSLRPLGRWIQEASREAGLPEDVAAGLDHALHEAVENIVRYAWADAAGHRIRVTFRCDAAQAEVEVEDDGRPFDPRLVPPPLAPVSLETLVPGGFGVAMMRHFTDEIGYQRDGALNRLTLRRSLAGNLEQR